jgi:hypothetical protein
MDDSPPESMNNNIFMSEGDELDSSSHNDGNNGPQMDEASQTHESDHTYASSCSSSFTPPPPQRSSPHGSEAQLASTQGSQHSVGSLAQERRFPRISSCISTQNKCCICGSFLGRNRISDEAMKQAWREVDIYIPKGNRCCTSHLNEERLFNNDVTPALFWYK